MPACSNPLPAARCVNRLLLVVVALWGCATPPPAAEAEARSRVHFEDSPDGARQIEGKADTVGRSWARRWARSGTRSGTRPRACSRPCATRSRAKASRDGVRGAAGRRLRWRLDPARGWVCEARDLQPQYTPQGCVPAQ